MSLNLVHLSDIHFMKRSGDSFDLDSDIRNELKRDLSLHAAKLGTLNGVVVTGDIAFSGQKEEYDQADRLLHEICDLCQIPRANVWVVPGNHDVDWQKVDKSYAIRLLHEEIRRTRPEELDHKVRGMLTGDTAAGLLSPLAEYVKFAQKFGCETGASKVTWHHDLQLNDGSILRLVGLNSVLFSSRLDDRETGRLVLGSGQLNLPRVDGVTYATLCHHPPEWLRDQDAVEDSLRSKVRLQLFGHKHTQRVFRHGESLRLVAGALHPERAGGQWQPTYNLLSVDVDGGQGRGLVVAVRTRVWDPANQRFTNLGEEVQTVRLPLDSWSPPPRPFTPVEVPAVAAAAEPTATAPSGRERDLVYRFMALSHPQRLKIGRTLELIRPEDDGVPDMELFRLIFERARSGNRLADLWDLVESASAGRRGNPFR